MNSKYKMFKNFMHNELGVTKEDIEQWTKEAVMEVAEKYVKHHLNEYIIAGRFSSVVTYDINNNEFIKTAIANAIDRCIKIEFIKDEAVKNSEGSEV